MRYSVVLANQRRSVKSFHHKRIILDVPPMMEAAAIMPSSESAILGAFPLRMFFDQLIDFVV